MLCSAYFVSASIAHEVAPSIGGIKPTSLAHCVVLAVSEAAEVTDLMCSD
jgi:hypothetical protein